jgi:hypothetical protein
MEDEPNLRMLVMKKAAGKFTVWFDSHGYLKINPVLEF